MCTDKLAGTATDIAGAVPILFLKMARFGVAGFRHHLTAVMSGDATSTRYGMFNGINLNETCPFVVPASEEYHNLTDQPCTWSTNNS